MLNETKEIYYKYKFNKLILNEVKDPVEHIYVLKNEMKELNNDPEKLKEFCKTNPKINELREIHTRLKKEREKYDEKKKVEEKNLDISKFETPSKPDAKKTTI